MPPAAAPSPHSLLHSTLSPRAGSGTRTRLTSVPSWPYGPAPHTSVHKIVTVFLMYFCPWLKGCVVNSFTLIYHHSHFSGSPSWSQGSVCA